MATPALLVHGIWDSASQLSALKEVLSRGSRVVHALSLLPNDGSVTVESIAGQIADASQRICDETRSEHVDLVGFSMGALACRYFIQRLGGRSCVRRFVSISGPHAGTWTAYASSKIGVRQMRPGSALLNDLAGDLDPWGKVAVHTLWTPYDLMILPARSSCLPGVASDHRVGTALHRWMLRDLRVLNRVVALLDDR